MATSLHFVRQDVSGSALDHEQTDCIASLGDHLLSLQVRLAFASMVGQWMCTLVERAEHEARLLPYILSALHDDSPDVADTAWQLLQAAGRTYEQDNAAEVQVRAGIDQ